MARRLSTRLAKAAAVAVVLLWSLGPIALIVLAAFTPEREIFSPTHSFATWRPTLANFTGLWLRWGEFFAGLLNSVIVTTGATVLAVIVSTLARHGYLRWRSGFLSRTPFAPLALPPLPPIRAPLPPFPIVNPLEV